MFISKFADKKITDNKVHLYAVFLIRSPISKHFLLGNFAFIRKYIAIKLFNVFLVW
jgi:hypothetical protein